MNLENAIPLGSDLDLCTKNHFPKNKLFSVFSHRIPERSNSAYEDYCRLQGISIEEVNLIILLGTIGSRGQSSFVFEKIFQSTISFADIIKIRKELEV